ncbi:MAG: ATP/GTP-binding protein [Thermoplasmatota archaeon]
MAENPIHMYFVGTAGAGKSTLVAAYDRWCKQNGLTTLLVNLDPGAEALPYQPDVDIRETIDLPTVMEEHGLGPNGAQIAAADMIALQLPDLIDEIQTYRADMVLIDTPGQVELFVFRLSGKLIVESIAPEQSALIYCLDPYLARTATGFTSQMMLAATTQFRFNQPMVHTLTKRDLIDEESLHIIQAWGEDPMTLENDVLAEEPSMSREMSAQVTRLLETMGLQNHLVAVTAVEDEGMADLYTQVQSSLGGSEDATPEYDTFLPHGQEEAK